MAQNDAANTATIRITNMLVEQYAGEIKAGDMNAAELTRRTILLLNGEK